MIKDKLEECVPSGNPLERPDYTEAEVQSVRAMFRGEATARQQRTVYDWFLRACATHDTSFRPDNQYLTAFAEGKRFAGTTLVWMLRSAPSRTDPDKIASRQIEDEKDARPDNR